MRETELQVFILNILHHSALFLNSWDAQGPGIVILIKIPPLLSRPWRPGDFSEQRYEISLEGEEK